MHTDDYQEPRFPKKWIIIPAVSLLLSVIPAVAFMGPSRGTLTGQVSFLGKPVSVGHVIAIAADGSMHSGSIDGRGQYVIAKIPGGKVQLGVVSRDPAQTLLRQVRLAQGSDRLPPEDRTAARSGMAGKWIALPIQYEDPRSSGIETFIKGSTEFHIELR
jgi:hypothetical protein